MASSVNLDTAEELNITCRRGDTFSLSLLLKDSSRSRGDDRNRELIIGSATRGKKDPKGKNFSFTTDDSGNLTITASSDVMKDVLPRTYVYDLQQILDGVSTTIRFGSFIVNDDISKIDITT